MPNFEIKIYWYQFGEIQWTCQWSEHNVDLAIHCVQSGVINTSDQQRSLESG